MNYFRQPGRIKRGHSADNTLLHIFVRHKTVGKWVLINRISLRSWKIKEYNHDWIPFFYSNNHQMCRMRKYWYIQRWLLFGPAIVNWCRPKNIGTCYIWLLYSRIFIRDFAISFSACSSVFFSSSVNAALFPLTSRPLTLWHSHERDLPK